MLINTSFSQKSDMQRAWVQSLEQDRANRLRRYALYWDFYLGKHWRSADYGGYPEYETDPLLVFNYCRRIVSKTASWLFSKGVEFVALKEYEALIPLINDTWETNKKNKFLMNAAIMGGVTGDVWVKVVYDTSWNSLHPIRLILVDSAIIEPVLNPHDMEDVQAVVISYPYYDETKDAVVDYSETITKEEIRIDDDGKITVEPNPYGFINVVHWQNLNIPGDFWGMSDLADIIPINEELNRKSTDISDIINYHSEPVTCIFGAKMKQIVQGANKTWSGFPKDARVENLQLNSDLKASNSYMERIKESLHEISGVPSGSLNTMGGISNASGIGLHIQFLPLIEKTLDKQITYGEGIKDVNDMIIRIAEMYDNSEMYSIDWNSLGDRKFNCIDTVFEMPLPKDRLIEMQLIREELSLGLESRKGAMERLKKRDIEEKLEEIDRERADDPLGIFNNIAGSSGKINNPKANVGGIVQQGDTPAGAVKEIVGSD